MPVLWTGMNAAVFRHDRQGIPVLQSICAEAGKPRLSMKPRSMAGIFNSNPFSEPLKEKANGGDDGGGNNSRIPTTHKDNPTMGHNSNKGNSKLDNNNIPPKGGSVCSKGGDTGNPSHQEV